MAAVLQEGWVIMNLLVVVLLCVLVSSFYLNMGFGIRKFGSLVFRNWPSGAFFEEDMRYAWALMWPFAILFIAIIAIIYALVWIFAKLFEAMRSIALFRHVINFFGRAIGYLFLGKMWKK